MLAIPVRGGEAYTLLSVPESTAQFHSQNISKLGDRVLSIDRGSPSLQILFLITKSQEGRAFACIALISSAEHIC